MTQNKVLVCLLADSRWLLIWLLIGFTLGYMTNQLYLGLILGLVVYIVRLWMSLYRLHQWVYQQSLDNKPQFIGVLDGLAQNIHKAYKNEKQAHSTLVNLIQRARQSLSALEEAVILIDKHDNLEWWNKSAETLLNLQKKDQGTNIFHLVRAPAFLDYYHQENYTDGVRIASWREDGCYLQFELTRFGDDRLLIIYDITRLYRLEQTRKDFVANVSHELRTPLTVLIGYLETLSDQDDLSPRWRRAFSQMQQQTRRMNNLVNDLLLLSRLESENLGANQKRIDMPKLMTQIFDDAQAYNNEHNHLIHLHIDSQCDICGAEKEIASAFNNLVTNAMKYTPNGGEISISWREEEGRGYFSVTDNGIGIAPQHVKRLTERFYRVDSGRSRETGGTGLGLAIVKHVLFQHGAHLEIQSQEGKGSTFMAVFPETFMCISKTSKHCTGLETNNPIEG